MIPLGNLIGWEWSHLGSEFQLSFNPMEGKHLPEHFVTANTDEISRALRLAQHAFEHFSGLAGEKRAQFLEQIAQAIETLGDSLLDRCHRETGLPMARLAGERGRTCNQLRLFAQLARSESWRAPVLDLADPERKPLPKPDIRTCFAALGPVLVFSAGNFPLAFSVAGGDTASALAVGCPVIVKGHEGHLGTSALVADCIRQAGLATGMPEGTFQMLQGPGPQVGRSLVLGEPIRAVGFTGSLHAGRALFDLAASRPNPIPFFAEMGSINPMVVTVSAQRPLGDLARTLVGSVCQNAGQFCTNPGLILVEEGPETDAFLDQMVEQAKKLGPEPMLNERTYRHFQESCSNRVQSGIGLLVSPGAHDLYRVSGVLGVCSAGQFLENPNWQEEVFGPFSLVVRCQDRSELKRVLDTLKGQLTATFWADPAELANYSECIGVMRQRAGRLLFNGVPTGVEVCHAMQHGGPYPASTDARFTSVGSSALRRWIQPQCFQNWPHEALPPALQNQNPLGIWRTINGEMTQAPL